MVGDAQLLALVAAPDCPLLFLRTAQIGFTTCFPCLTLSATHPSSGAPYAFTGRLPSTSINNNTVEIFDQDWLAARVQSHPLTSAGEWVRS